MTNQTSMKGPFYKVENSWQYTTIYDADDEPVCQFDLGQFDDLNENTQDALDKIMQRRVDFVLERLNR